MALQAALNRRGYTDSYGKALLEDGFFGPRTGQALVKYTSTELGRGQGYADDRVLQALGITTSAGAGSNPAFKTGGASSIPPGGTAAGGANTFGPSMITESFEAAGPLASLRQASNDYLGMPLEYAAGALLGGVALLYIWKRK